MPHDKPPAEDRLDAIAQTVCFQDVRDAAAALQPMAAALRALSDSSDPDDTERLESAVSTLVQGAVLLESRLHRVFTAALGPTPRHRNVEALRDRLRSIIRRGRADLSRLYSSWLWGSPMFAPYILQTNGGFPMGPALAEKLLADFDGDRARMQGDMILRSLLPAGEAPRRIATLQEVSAESLAHVISAQNIRPYAEATTAPGVTYTFRHDRQGNTAIILEGSEPPEVIADFMAGLSDPGAVAGQVERLLPPGGQSVEAALRETLSSSRMLAVRSGAETIVTAHLPSISTVREASRNIRAYLAIVVMLREKVEAEGGRILLNADANLPVTGTIADKATGAEHDPKLGAILDRIDGVTFWYASAMPKRRSESLLDNQQAIAKGGVGVMRSTMISATIGPPPPRPPRNPQPGRPLLTADNTTDHQIIDTGESITMNCGYTGADESSALLRGRLDRRRRLKQGGDWEELEALMQASAVMLWQDMAPLIEGITARR